MVPRTSPALAPPGDRGGDDGTFGPRPTAAVVITHVQKGGELGKRVHVHENGFAIGGSDDDIQVLGATATGTRLELLCVSSETSSGEPEWRARGVGQVRIGGRIAASQRLVAGDELRVVDTFFRFLFGTDLDRQYHETIYRLTILDTPTGLPNARYLRETLERELAWVESRGSAVTVAVFRLASADIAPGTTHDLVSDLSKQVGLKHSDRRMLGRTDDLELALVWPDASVQEVGEALGRLSRPEKAAAMKIGLAQSRPGLDATRLIAAARANAEATDSTPG